MYPLSMKFFLFRRAFRLFWVVLVVGTSVVNPSTALALCPLASSTPARASFSFETEALTLYETAAQFSTYPFSHLRPALVRAGAGLIYDSAEARIFEEAHARWQVSAYRSLEEQTAWAEMEYTLGVQGPLNEQIHFEPIVQEIKRLYRSGLRTKETLLRALEKSDFLKPIFITVARLHIDKDSTTQKSLLKMMVKGRWEDYPIRFEEFILHKLHGDMTEAMVQGFLEGMTENQQDPRHVREAHAERRARISAALVHGVWNLNKGMPDRANKLRISAFSDILRMAANLRLYVENQALHYEDPAVFWFDAKFRSLLSFYLLAELEKVNVKRLFVWIPDKQNSRLTEPSVQLNYMLNQNKRTSANPLIIVDVGFVGRLSLTNPDSFNLKVMTLQRYQQDFDQARTMGAIWHYERMQREMASFASLLKEIQKVKARLKKPWEKSPTEGAGGSALLFALPMVRVFVLFLPLSIAFWANVFILGVAFFLLVRALPSTFKTVVTLWNSWRMGVRTSRPNDDLFRRLSA
jgi:hypothetical protein